MFASKVCGILFDLGCCLLNAVIVSVTKVLYLSQDTVTVDKKCCFSFSF